MTGSRLAARPARGSLVRGIAGIAALYVALALVVAYLTRSPDAAPSGGATAAAGPVSSAPAPAGVVPAPSPAPPAVTPAEILAAPAVTQQEPVVPLPPDREDRADVLSDVRKQRVAEMLEQQARRREQARAQRR